MVLNLEKINRLDYLIVYQGTNHRCTPFAVLLLHGLLTPKIDTATGSFLKINMLNWNLVA